MGLQFRDEAGNERTLTLTDMATDDFKDSYSDLFKVIYDFRPRGEHLWTPEVMLAFFDSYEERFAEKEKEWEEEREARLDYLKCKHQRNFTSLKEAEDFNVQAALARYEREAEAERQEKDRKAEMTRRFSPLPVIEDWMYGTPA